MGALGATHRLPSQPSLALPRGPAARRFVTPSCALAPSHHPSIHPSISPASRRRPPPKPAGSINPCTRLLPIQPSLARAGPGASHPALINLLNSADQSKPTHTRSTHRVHPHTHLGRTAPAGSTPPTPPSHHCRALRTCMRCLKRQKKCERQHKLSLRTRLHQQDCEVVDGRECVRVPVPERLPVRSERLSEQRLRLRVAACGGSSHRMPCAANLNQVITIGILRKICGAADGRLWSS